MTLISAIVLLFLVMDPIGNTVTFNALLRRVAPARRPRVILRECIIALVVLLVFLFAGGQIMSILHVSQESMGITGGIVLFLIAIKMIFRGSEETFSASEETEPFFVPLAVPLIAGPSAMATVVLLMAREPDRWFSWLLALFLAWFAGSIILLLSERLATRLGPRTMRATERLMGMLLTTIAVEMLIQGIREAFLK